VVVVGAGFAGLAACQVLATEGRHAVEVVVVDRHSYNTFQPLLYQVATAGLNPGDIAYPVRSYLRSHENVSFRLGEVVGVDLDKRQVVLAEGEQLSYDYLVLATGATTNFFGVPGARENAHAIYTMEDAVKVRDRLAQALEQAASFGPTGGGLTVVIVGGGPTGVEMAGALAELWSLEISTSFKNLEKSAARIVLVEQLDRLLAAFDQPLSRYCEQALWQRGVEVMLGRSVKEVRPDRVVLDGDEEIACKTVIWSAGVSSGALADSMQVGKTKGGRLAVEASLCLSGHREVFAAGDIAGATEDGGVLPQLAQPALQEGRHVGRQILARLSGEKETAFSYKDKGIMATIGRRAAVAELPSGVKLRGTLAWLAWLGLHIVFLLGLRNRLAVLLNWAWRYLWWKRGNRVIAGV
jgi:NADH dehydrogenase